ncbi:Clathrin light chain [Savitreella phatthalungensis]
MSAFPSLDEFEGGATSASRASGSAFVSSDGGDFMGELSTQQQKFPEIGETGDLLDQEGSFERSFPAVGGDSQGGQFGMISAPSGPYIPGGGSAGAEQVTKSFARASLGGADGEEGGEPQVIRDWREKQAIQIERRDEVSRRRKEETIAAARTAVDDFYDNYNAKRDKEIARTRKQQEEMLAQRDDTQSGGTTWERIAKLVDLKDGAKGSSGPSAAHAGRDVSRMRDLLVSLRKDQNAPSAGL